MTSVVVVGADKALTTTIPPRTLLASVEAFMLWKSLETALPAAAVSEMTLTLRLVEDTWRRRPSTMAASSSRRRPGGSIVMTQSSTAGLRAWK